MDADGDGKANDQAFRKNQGVGSTSLFVGDPEFVGELGRNGRDAISTTESPVSQNGFTSRYVYIARDDASALPAPTDEKSKAQERDKASPARSDASRIVPLPSSGLAKSDSWHESYYEPIGRATVTNYFSAGIFGGEVNVAEGSRGGSGSGGGGGADGLRFLTRTNSYAADDAFVTPPASGENAVTLDSFSIVPNPPAIDPSTGLPMAQESGLDRADGGVAVTRRLDPPGVIASTIGQVTNSGSLELGEERRFAEVRGDKAPVLGDSPMLGKLFRNEPKKSARRLVAGLPSYETNTHYRKLATPGTETLGRDSTNVLLLDAQSPNKSGEGALTLSGGNRFGGGTNIAGAADGGIEALSNRYKDHQEKIRKARKELEDLRLNLKISEMDASGSSTGPTIEAEDLRHIKASAREGEVRLNALQVAVSNLHALSPGELRQVLPRTRQDQLLAESLNQLNSAEQQAADLRKNSGSNNPAFLQMQRQVDTLNEKVDEQVVGIMAALDIEVTRAQTEVAGLKKQAEEAQGLDLEKTQKSRPYFDKKRELEDLYGFARILSMKLAAERIDLALPKTTMVEITGKATPAKEKTGFWRSLGAPVGGSFASTARVKVERDATDIEGMAGNRMNLGYDPFFIQIEFETLQSEAVLGKVVDALKLDEAWSAKSGGEKLKKAEAIALLKNKLDLRPVPNTSLVEIHARSDQPDEAAKIANAVAEAYKVQRQQERMKLASGGIKALEERYQEQQGKIREAQKEVDRLRAELAISEADAGGSVPRLEADAPPVRKPSTNAPIPQPEVQTSENAFSTFSLNVSDVSFKLAAASLEKGQMPDATSVRSEEFINAFDYRDPEPLTGVPIAFAWERARYPFAHNRDLLRFSLKTAAAGRQAGRPLNIVLLLDNSGSMERADRVSIIREALRVLAGQLQPQDKLSVIMFARTARLVADGISGDKAGEVAEQVSGLTPQGGTNLEDAMNLAYQTAARHYLASGINRVLLLTDGAANLGNVEPESLKQKVEAQRKQGIALDCFGIGWEGFNDDLLEVLSRNGDGRYGFINSPEEAATEFAGQLAGALKVAASDVKVQVEFNPKRVTSYRQIGYAKHQLTKEQFRDNTVDAAEIAEQEAGNALYTVEVNLAGEGPLATVHVRYKIPGTSDYREQAWDVPYAGNALSLEQSSPAMRLAASASAFSEWLVASPFAGEVTPDRLLGYLRGVPKIYGADVRPKKLEWMIRQAKSIEGK